MPTIDENLLQRIGMGGLPSDIARFMMSSIYEMLEMRVGIELASAMTDKQLDEFEEFMRARDEDGALRWLETTFPTYKGVVREKFEGLESEIAAEAPGFREAMREVLRSVGRTM